MKSNDKLAFLTGKAAFVCPKNGQKGSKMVENGRKWSKMVENGQKWSKMVKNGQKGSKRVKKSNASKIVKIDKNVKGTKLIKKKGGVFKKCQKQGFLAIFGKTLKFLF